MNISARSVVERGPRVAQCPKCGCDDWSMLELTEQSGRRLWFCNNCAHDWSEEPAVVARFRAIEDLVARTGVNREELVQLAEVGALSSFGFDRREALWQVERAIRPAGELFDDSAQWAVGSGQWTVGSRQYVPAVIDSQRDGSADNPGSQSPAPSPDLFSAERPAPSAEICPLPPMTLTERLIADYAGTSLTIGPHPMALRRPELAMRGVLRAIDLTRERHGRRVRVAGAVITRQRPGTAKGFVFLTLEDETGIANVIIRPDLFGRDRLTIIEEPFLVVEGTLQNQEGVTSVRAERLDRLGGEVIDVESRDFY